MEETLWGCRLGEANDVETPGVLGNEHGAQLKLKGGGDQYREKEIGLGGNVVENEKGGRG